MSLAKRAARGTMFVVAGQYASMLINFGTTVVLARLLSPTDFGVFALATFFFTFIDVTGKVNLDFALMHRQNVEGAAFPTHFVLKILCSIASFVLAGIVGLVLPWFGYQPIVSKVLLVLAAVGIIQAAGTTSWMVLEKELRFARTMSVTVMGIVLSSIITIFLAWQGWGVLSLVLGAIGNALFVTGGMWLVSPWRSWQAFARTKGSDERIRAHFAGLRTLLVFDWDLAKWYLRFGSALVLGAYATIILFQFDNFLVGSFAGIAALGFYDRAYRFANLPTGLVTHVASRAALPIYAKVQEDRGRLSYAFRATLEVIASISLPLAVVLFVSAPDFVTFLLGDAWLPAAPILRLLLGYSLMRPFLDDTGALMTAVGRPEAPSRFIAAGAAALVVVATPLTFLFGAVGTALGVNVALATGIIVSYAYVRKEVDVPYRQILLAPLTGALIALGVGFLMVHAVDVNGLPVVIRLVIKVVTTLVVYLAVVLAMERKRLLYRTQYVWKLVRGG